MGRGGGKAEVGELRTPHSVSQAQAMAAAYVTQESQSDPSTGQLGPHELVSSWLDQAENTDADTSQVEDFSVMSQEELQKKKKRLEKKLAQVRKLESRVSRGDPLSQEEESKLQRKSDLVDEVNKVTAALL
ncbi:uncharacterized protein LOC101847439 [Aplysia californica]|uniref:Uncharacterized protein LOC101847439 n=1 Tax=Aplysia californica TaxID=6500 RepID=A0ABM0JWP6_APLCA|nr:uncharacterized protein LOC101847439 [Aplysia californica]